MNINLHILPAVCILLCGLTVYLSPTVSATVQTSNSRQRQTGASPTIRASPSTQAVRDDFVGYIPNTPSPGDVNCYIEVPTMLTVGGRCVPFGRSRMWSCQSGIHIQMSNECERMTQTVLPPNRRRTRNPRS
uniref:Uncharacterized protein n=1 Tax=Arion vulgaris TaxID=1028688 RepID=A0A0B7BHK3_9EUPU